FERLRPQWSHRTRPLVKSFARRARLDLYSRARGRRDSPVTHEGRPAPKPGGSPTLKEAISRLLRTGQETIVRDWTEKVTSDRRINSDARLSYLQLIDHIPEIVEELQEAIVRGEREAPMLN